MASVSSTERDRAMFPYLKKPAHLTGNEDKLISDVCDGLQSLDKAFERAEKFKISAAERRVQVLEQEEHCRYLEARLAEHEKSAIRTRDPIERKEIEGHCKEFRKLIADRKMLTVEMKQHVNHTEEVAAQIEGNAQGLVITRARTILHLCDSVRRRREKEGQGPQDTDY